MNDDLAQRSRECLDQRFNITAQLTRQECCEVMVQFARAELEVVKQILREHSNHKTCRWCGKDNALYCECIEFSLQKIGERQK